MGSRGVVNMAMQLTLTGVRDLYAQLGGLVIFRNLLDKALLARFRTVLQTIVQYKESPVPLAEALGAFEFSLLQKGDDWSAVLLDLVLEDDNLWIRKAAAGGAGEVAQACLVRELSLLQQAGALTMPSLLSTLPNADHLTALLPAPWKVSTLDYAAAYRQRCAQISRTGYGLFAHYRAFTLENGALVPVRCPDNQRLDQMPGYERERRKVLENTQALLAGKPAANVLLYGDAGTGKSSTVKAIANEYAGQGLRLIEVKKNQLYQLPALMDELAQNPLKFILFIDDLSFAANDDNFAALKAILEGSVGGRSQNVAVYATSNRRHLVKERMSDRTGDDLHEADTRQELMSLSARFGLTVTFQRPDKALFDRIVQELARQYGVEMPADRLLVQAGAFALRAGGRSPRVAKQFVELVAAGVEG